MTSPAVDQPLPVHPQPHSIIRGCGESISACDRHLDVAGPADGEVIALNALGRCTVIPIEIDQSIWPGEGQRRKSRTCVAVVVIPTREPGSCRSTRRWIYYHCHIIACAYGAV